MSTPNKPLLADLDPFDPRQYVRSKKIRDKAPKWLNDINWSTFHDDKLDPAIIKGAHYILGVEAHTPGFAIYPALNKHNFRSPERSMTRASWEVDEGWHAYAAYAVLKASDTSLVDFETLRERQVQKNERFGHIKRPLTAVAINNILLPAQAASAVINVSGVINEDTTGNVGYTLLGELSDHAEYNKLSRYISREEAGHGSDYAGYAHEDLEGHPFYQKVTRKFMEQFWVMVGGGYMPENELVGMVNLVAEHPNFYKAVERVDSRTARLPGMENATLLQDYLEPRLSS